jgi:hypothetical protein
MAAAEIGLRQGDEHRKRNGGRGGVGWGGGGVGGWGVGGAGHVNAEGCDAHDVKCRTQNTSANNCKRAGSNKK